MAGTEAAIGGEARASLMQGDDIPWIDAFLAGTPATAVTAALAEPMESHPSVAIAENEFVMSAGGETVDVSGAPSLDTTGFSSDAAQPLTTALTGEVIAQSSEVVGTGEQVADWLRPAVTDGSDETEVALGEWALDEAADEIDILSREFGSTSATDTSPASLFAEPRVPPSLPAWTDGDLVDLVPQGQAASVVAGAGHPPIDGNAEAAAHALELLAERVRAGELSMTGYEPRTGDAGALVAALAALLGFRT